MLDPVLPPHVVITQYATKKRFSPMSYDPTKGSVETFQTSEHFKLFSENFRRDLTELQNLSSQVLTQEQATTVNDYLMNFISDLLIIPNTTDTDTAALHLAYNDLRHNIRVLLVHLNFRKNRSHQQSLLLKIFHKEFHANLEHLNRLNQDIIEQVQLLPEQGKCQPKIPELSHPSSHPDRCSASSNHSIRTVPSLSPPVPWPEILPPQKVKFPQSKNKVITPKSIPVAKVLPIVQPEQITIEQKKKSQTNKTVLQTLARQQDEFKHSQKAQTTTQTWKSEFYVGENCEPLEEILSRLLKVPMENLLPFSTRISKQLKEFDKQTLQKFRCCLAEIEIQSPEVLSTQLKAVLTFMSLPDELDCEQNWLINISGVHALLASTTLTQLSKQAQSLAIPNEHNFEKWAACLNRSWLIKTPPTAEISLEQFKEAVFDIVGTVFYNENSLIQELNALFSDPIFQTTPTSDDSDNRLKLYRLIQLIHPMLLMAQQNLATHAEKQRLQLAIVAMLPDDKVTIKQCFSRLKHVKGILETSISRLQQKYKILNTQSDHLFAYQLARVLEHDDLAQRLNPSICHQVMKNCTIL